MLEGSDHVSNMLSLAMQGLEVRSKLISNNIANVNTAGYKRSYVEFEEALTHAKVQLDKAEDEFEITPVELSTTHSNHISVEGNTQFNNQLDDYGIEVQQDPSSYSADGNNVRLDQELNDLTKTGLKYNGMAELMKRHVTNLRGIIRG